MLAIGIGATTAIFSIVEGVLLRPLPFPHSGRLMVLADILQGAEVGGNGEAGVTVPDIRNYTRDTHSFTSLGGYQGTGFELSGMGDPAAVNATRMSAGDLPGTRGAAAPRTLLHPTGGRSAPAGGGAELRARGRAAFMATSMCWERRFCSIASLTWSSA